LLRRLCAEGELGPAFERQVATLAVREVGWEQQLELRPDPRLAATDAVKTDGMVSDATYRDSDGEEVWLALHAAHGLVWFLERLKGPSVAPIARREPSLDELHYGGRSKAEPA
jgi:hypothetical protein